MWKFVFLDSTYTQKKDNLIISEGYNYLPEEVQTELAIINSPRQKLLAALEVIKALGKYLEVFLSLFLSH